MADFMVEQLQLHDRDAVGLEVRAIYAKNHPFYAVYRTPSRVAVQFSDNAAEAAAQRAALTPLGPLRSEIAGLIDGWHGNPNRRLQAKAERYDRRVGDSIVMALQGDAVAALLLLQEIRDDLVADRKSSARFEYLLVAAGTAAVAFLLLAIASVLPWVKNLYPGVGDVWRGAAGGTMGAVFSIAIGLRGRTILTDLHWRDNACDAILRVMIGMIGAALIICLFKSRIITSLTLDHVAADGWTQIVVIGFLAGFSERLVPDLLSKVGVLVDQPGVAARQAAGAQAVVNQAAAAAAAAVGAAAPPPAGGDSADDLSDNCLCDEPPDDSESTADSDLPAAAGGVAA